MATTRDTDGIDAPITSSSDDGDPAQGPDLVCTDPAPVEVGLGTPESLETTDAVPTTCAWVEVPEDLDSITFSVSDLDDDLDLVVGYGFVATVQYNTGEVWESRMPATGDESVTIVDPAPGPYFVKLGPAATDAVSPFELTVVSEPAEVNPPTGDDLPDGSSCEGPAEQLAVGDSVDGEVIARTDDPLARSYFCVDTDSDFTVDLTGLSGNLDVLVRTADGEVVGTDRTRGGDTRTVTVTGAGDGPFYVEVIAALAGASSPFTITVS